MTVRNSVLSANVVPQIRPFLGNCLCQDIHNNDTGSLMDLWQVYYVCHIS